MNFSHLPLPNTLPRPADELPRLERVWETPRGWRFFTTVNNTNIGLLYIGTSLLFFLLAGVLGLLIRLQLAVPDNTLLDASTYNQVFTMHGTVMMFLFAIPVVEAIAVYLLPGMTLRRMPVYAWSMLVVGVMIVFAFPAIIAGTALLELERAFDWPFFIAARGGDPLLWQHLFWFFGHPEVYIIFLPAAGMVSTMIPTIAGTPLVGQRAVVIALVGVGFFSFALWAHHMSTAGLGLLGMAFVSAASMAVAVWACGIVAIVAVIAWLWQSDQPPVQASARVADGVTLPVGAAGRASQSWWATMIMLVVDATVFASFLFAYIHISMRLTGSCPPPNAALPAPLWPLLSCGLLLAGSALLAYARRSLRSQRSLRLGVMAAAVCMAAAFACGLNGQQLAGLDPSAQAWSATVAVMLSYQGLHAILLLIIAAYLCARSWTGKLTLTSRATLDNSALIWHYTTLQGISFAIAVNVVPLFMN